jgi:hypothetical protein
VLCEFPTAPVGRAGLGAKYSHARRAGSRASSTHKDGGVQRGRGRLLDFGERDSCVASPGDGGAVGRGSRGVFAKLSAHRRLTDALLIGAVHALRGLV